MFLDAYGWGELGRGWPRRMMARTLAHDYDMMQPVAPRIPAGGESLEDLGLALAEAADAGRGEDDNTAVVAVVRA